MTTPADLAPAAPAASAATAPAPSWAVIELMGHQRIAGQVIEQTIAGAGFLRVDVPAITYTRTEPANHGAAELDTTVPAHSRSLHPQAVYSVVWCDEATARAQARLIHHQPISPWSLAEAIAGMDHMSRRRFFSDLAAVVEQAE